MQAPTLSKTRIDHILREKLMLGDLSANEVADGLARRFADQAAILTRDRTGQSAAVPAMPMQGSQPASMSESELVKARDDVERDLQGLIVEPQLKDVTPELRGWRGAITRLVEDGAAAAPFALDQRQRDRVFDVRRSLGDYARLARLLGAATPQFNGPYRQLAKSLDDATALMLVVAGDAIAIQGQGGAAPLPAPASDLQARRDAVLSAVRSLVGSAQQSYGTDEWPRGLHAFRELNEALQESGHGELRAMLNEQYLGRTMDALIDQASGNNAYALRALGATSGVVLSKFERFLELANQPDPESPPLATLRNALRLFIDSFQSDATGRLVTISRPALLAGSQQDVNLLDNGRGRLLRIIQQRSLLALALDCFLGCDCEPGRVKCQVVFDKLLYDTDRAIDLYLQSQDPQGDGPAEQRAAAYGVLMGLLATNLAAESNLPDDDPALKTLNKLRDHCFGSYGEDVYPAKDAYALDPSESLSALSTLLLEPVIDHVPVATNAPARRSGPARRMRNEICMQRRTEERWFVLAGSMTPGCFNLAGIHDAIDNLLAAGLYVLGSKNMICPDVDDDIPPDVATSLAALAYERPSEGRQADIG